MPSLELVRGCNLIPNKCAEGCQVNRATDGYIKLFEDSLDRFNCVTCSFWQIVEFGRFGYSWSERRARDARTLDIGVRVSAHRRSAILCTRDVSVRSTLTRC